MESIQLPQGDGQEIYIDAKSLYIKPEWINKKEQAIVFPEYPPSQSNPVYEAYKEMFEQFYKKGYKIVTDSRMVNENTFFFSPCLDEHINNTKEDYRGKQEKKIDSCLENVGIEKPLTVTFPIDSFPTSLLPLPFVLKNEESQGGEEKFLIKTPKQIEIIKRFYKEADAYARKIAIEEVKRQWPCYPDLTFDENGRSNHVIQINFVDYKKEFHQNMRIQKFIKTPTKYNTSLRVLTSSSGDILASSLKYSLPTINTQEKFYGLFDKFLSDPSSPYFIGAESIVSNTVAGGDSILLEKDNYSEEEQEILIAHGILPNNAIVPQKVMKACIEIAVQCKHEIGAICGMDFIYDEEEKAWKYLEQHQFPMLYSYAEKYGLPYDFNAKDIYTTEKLLDLKIRLHSLVLTMQKKQSLTSEQGKKL